VFAVGIIVTFDVLEEFGLGIDGVLEASVLKHFELEGPDEGLGPRVVVGICSGGHALVQAGFGQGVAEWGAPILASAVTVEDDTVAEARFEGLEKCGEDQV